MQKSKTLIIDTELQENESIRFKEINQCLGNRNEP